MAGPARQPAQSSSSFVSRHKLLLALVYLGLYGWLRVGGDIIHQTVPVLGPMRLPVLRQIVAPASQTEHWKRQVCRIAFSPMMVAEEELRAVAGLAKAQVPEEAWEGLATLKEGGAPVGTTLTEEAIEELDLDAAAPGAYPAPDYDFDRIAAVARARPEEAPPKPAPKPDPQPANHIDAAGVAAAGYGN